MTAGDAGDELLVLFDKANDPRDISADALVLELQSTAEASVAMPHLASELVALSAVAALVEAEWCRPVFALLQTSASTTSVQVAAREVERQLDGREFHTSIADSLARIFPDRARDPRDNYAARFASLPSASYAERTVSLTRAARTSRVASGPEVLGYWTAEAAATHEAMARARHGVRTTTGTQYQLKTTAGEPSALGLSVKPIPFRAGAGPIERDLRDFFLYTLLVACKTELS